MECGNCIWSRITPDRSWGVCDWAWKSPLPFWMDRVDMQILPSDGTSCPAFKERPHA